MKLADESGMAPSMPAPSDGPRTAGHGIAEVLLDALFENSNDAVVVVEADGTIRHVTSNTSLLVGHDRHSAIGRSVFDYLHPDDAASVADLFERRLDFTGRDLGTMLRVVDAHGSIVRVNATAAVLPSSAAGLDIGACVITLRTVDESSGREHALQRRIVVNEYVNRLGADLLAAPDPDAVFARIDTAMTEIGLLTGANGARVVIESSALADQAPESLSAWTHEGRDGDDWPAGDPVAADLLLSRAVVTNDASADPTLAACLPASCTSVVGSPFTANGRRCAVVLTRHDGVSWWESDVELARAVGRLLARAIQAAWSERLLSLTYRQAPVAFGLHNWNGDLLDCNDRYLELLQFERDAAHGRSLVASLRDDDRVEWTRLVEQLRSGRTDRFEIDVPVQLRDRSEIWVRCHSVRLDVPGSAEGMLLTSCTDITASRHQRLQLEYAANHDDLTGVANRTALWRQLDAGAAAGNLPTMLVIDLDRFKLVNDGHGHSIGDAVLQVVARRLQHTVRHGDLVARLGGDEFAIALPNTTAAEAAAIAERIIDTVRAPIQVDDQRFVQTISIGIASGADASDPAELMVCADRALYEAKHRGRCQRVVFSPTEEPSALVDVKLERELRAALQRNEFEVYFQPEFRIADRRVVGAEALLRWRHPTRGLVPAAEFIAVAERTGAIDDLGRYALRHATESFADACRRAGVDDLVLRVNLSAREFARAGLTDITRSALDRSGLAPQQLCLEMTETTLMDAPDIAMATLASLRQLGVRFAIDDFGTGHSSLAYLKRFPVDVLKIDRTFVSDIDRDDESAAIVRSIVQLARAMSLDVVAEGVEQQTQLDALAEIGCHRAQGFLLAAPIPIDELIDTFVGDRALSSAVA